MKQIVTNQTVKIPEGLTVTVKSRLVTVKGPRGVLKRSFKHLALDIRVCGLLSFNILFIAYSVRLCNINNNYYYNLN